MKIKEKRVYASKGTALAKLNKKSNTTRLQCAKAKVKLVTLEDKWSLDCGPDVIRLVD